MTQKGTSNFEYNMVFNKWFKKTIDDKGNKLCSFVFKIRVFLGPKRGSRRARPELKLCVMARSLFLAKEIGALANSFF